VNNTSGFRVPSALVNITYIPTVSFDCEFIGSYRSDFSLFCNNNQVANLGAEIFVVCERTIDEYEELCTL
jgi:hypothetical protein